MSIPKIIHYCWLGGNEKPESVLNCIDSWRKFCPDYEIKEWNEKNLNIAINAYTEEAYNAKAWGFVPDYLRLWIIYNHGGIYLDTDVQVIRSFDSLIESKGFAGFEKGTEDENGYYVNFGQGFAAEKYNPLIKAHMEMYENLHFLLSDGSLNKIASPHYTTDVLVDFGLNRKLNSKQDLDYFTIYSDDYFCPKSFATGLVKKTENTYSIHQFDGSWYSEEEQLQRIQWEKAARKDYYLHIPNRCLRKILGDKWYEKLKLFLKRG